MVPARFIQGEFDLQEAEHLGMTIKAICTQGKQVAHYPLCSVAFRTQRRGGNLKTVIPFLLTVSCAFRDVEMHGAWLHSFPRSLTEDAMKAPAGLKICDLGSVGMGLGRPRIPFIIILTSLYISRVASLKQALVSPLCAWVARAFFTDHPSPRGVKGKVTQPSAPEGDGLNSSSIEEDWRCWRYYETLVKIQATILCRNLGQLNL